MAKDNFISNDDEVYRSVRGDINDEEYCYDDNGKLIIRYKAFCDRTNKPSVSRANLLNNEPAKARLGKGQGIVSLITKDIREKIIDIQTDDTKHLIDVISDPLSDDNDADVHMRNKAHALIVVSPGFYGTRSKKDKVFKRLQLALARLATEKGWTLKPDNT